MFPQRFRRPLLIGLAVAVVAGAMYVTLARDGDAVPFSVLECGGRGSAVVAVPNATHRAGEVLTAATFLHNPTESSLSFPYLGEFTVYRVVDDELHPLTGASLVQDYAEPPDPVPPGGIESFEQEFPSWRASLQDGSPAPPGLYLYHVDLDRGRWCGHATFIVE